MRWIFFFLFVLNVSLAAWYLTVGTRQSSTGMDGGRSVSTDRHVISRLRLLRESSGGKPVVSLARVGDQGIVEAGFCISVGPLTSYADAKGVLEEAGELGVSGRIDRRSVVTGATHWVYITPDKAGTAAKARLAELQRRKIDSYLIPSGELEGNISLGVFSRKASAQARQNTLLKQGLRAEVRTIEKTVDKWWLLFWGDSGHKTNKKAFDAFLKQKNLASEQENSCLDVASDQNFH